MVDMNLFSHVVDELVICTTDYLPVAGKSGMRDDEVTRGVAIGVTYFGVVDTDPMSCRGLSVVNRQLIR